jgi:[ribosomal protein S18]-alanine N-acetyltransferase
VLDFAVRPMTAADAHAVAAWRYPGEYSFYDADADPDDLAELLDPAEWGHRYFAVDEPAEHKLAGFVMVKLTSRVAEIGLGLRPDLTGHGLGESFVRTCLRFAAAELGAQSYILAVAAFNRRAITRVRASRVCGGRTLRARHQRRASFLHPDGQERGRVHMTR